MKRKVPAMLSVLIACAAFLIAANLSGATAIESDSETSVTTTKPTTIKIETTTKVTWPWQKTDPSSTVDVSGIISSIADELTSTKAPASSDTSETQSESGGSETEKADKTSTAAKTTTTKKPTTTVKGMTITVVLNTTIPGGTMDPLSAYYSRLSEMAEGDETSSSAQSADEEGGEEGEDKTNPAVTVIIAVAAMLIAISLLTGLFTIRNKRLAEKEAAAESGEPNEGFSGDVIISKSHTRPEFTAIPVDDEDEAAAGETVPGAATDEVVSGEAASGEPQSGKPAPPQASSDKTEEDAAEDTEKAPPADVGSSDSKEMEYEDIFSGRDDL